MESFIYFGFILPLICFLSKVLYGYIIRAKRVIILGILGKQKQIYLFEYCLLYLFYKKFLLVIEGLEGDKVGFDAQ